jgi:hypothetical protein
MPLRAAPVMLRAGGRSVVLSRVRIDLERLLAAYRARILRDCRRFGLIVQRQTAAPAALLFGLIQAQVGLVQQGAEVFVTLIDPGAE